MKKITKVIVVAATAVVVLGSIYPQTCKHREPAEGMPEGGRWL